MHSPVPVYWKQLGSTTVCLPYVFTVALLLQEICSFLKGSAEAMDSPDGKLSLESYLEVGRKRIKKIHVVIPAMTHT